jgi:hypothetical protein
MLKVKAEIFDESLNEDVPQQEAVERIKILDEYVEKRYQEEVEGGASEEEAIEQVKKDLSIAKVVVKMDQEIKKDQTKSAKKAPVLKAQLHPEIDPNAVTLMIHKWLNQDADEAKVKAAKVLVFAKLAECSHNPNQEKLSMLQKAINNLKDVSQAALNGLGIILGAPQEAEAIPLVLVPIVVDGLLFLADNPEIWHKIPHWCSSLMALSTLEHGISEKRRADAKPKAALAPKAASRASGGAAMPPPEGDEGTKKSGKQTPQPKTREEQSVAFKNIKSQLDRLFQRKTIDGKTYWINEKGNPINIDRLHYNHYHILDKRNISEIIEEVFVDWKLP